MTWLQWLKHEYGTRDALPLVVLLAPVVWLIVIDPGSFSLIWFWGRQIGRAGFAFIFFLVAWDWHDSRRKLKATRTRWRQALALIVLSLVLVYYWERVVNSAWTDYLRVYVTSRMGVSQESPLSFLLAADFVVYALYFIVITAVLYSPSAASLLITPVIYALGSGILDMMDAFFPEDSLAFLQVWVYVIWNVVIFILSVLGFHNAVKTPFGPIPPPTVLLEGNHLYLWGLKGFITLTIFWPSSGVVSMIVYSLVIAVLMVKLEAPRKRKAAYAIVGALGTYLVNVARITMIVLYVTYISLDVEAFHESIGEILFICWIFAYLLVVIRIENLLSVRSQMRKI
ncbi:MAG TPA: exosortase/archaeosortase family protein [Candidatus Bathyarchaeia archaeon]|nr:exosortase/archaeosortase family protein [Candidatus Bathyarchaeia archaeon]